jgi:uncharacterized OB-fold protein
MSGSEILIGGSLCDRCGEIRLPAVERCPSCRSTEVVPCEVDGTGRILAVSEVQTPPRDGESWLAVLADVAGGLRVVGLGRPPIAVGDEVVMVDDEDGVPVFATSGGSHGR